MLNTLHADNISEVIHAADINALAFAVNRKGFDVQTMYGAAGDGATNDTAAIDAALTDAEAAGGGVVYFPKGVYLVDAASLPVPSNVTWMGAGRGQSVIKLRDGANGRLLSQTTAKSNVEFRGLTFDFNMANQTDGASRDDRAGHFLANVDDLRYVGCEITGCRSGAAVRLDGCDRTLLLGNHFHDNGFHTILTGAHTLPLATLTVASTTGFASAGSLMVGDNQLVTYTGKTATTFTGCAGGAGTIADGCAVLPATAGGSPMMADHNFNANADHLRVLGNTYFRATDTGTAQDGIQHSAVVGNTYEDNILGVSICNSTTRISRFNTISGNSIKGSERFRGSVGIKVSNFGNAGAGNMTDGAIVGNIVHLCDRCMWVEHIDRLVIVGNDIGERNASGTNGQLLLLSTNGAMNDVQIAHNIIHTSSNRGISFSGGVINNLDVESNKFVGVSVPIGGVIPVGARLRNNRGYNPLGAQAVAPAASPWTYTAGATPEILYLRGGAVSDVSKNGQTLAVAAPAAVPLDPGEQVIVTYTAAPTAVADRK